MTLTAADLKQTLRELLAYLERGNCVLFLGAGVHAPPPQDSPYDYPEAHRLPLGGDLAEQLSEAFGFVTHEQFQGESPRDLQRVALFVETNFGRSALVNFLDEQLKKNRKPSPILRMLAEMPFKIFVTTNYDRLLEKALAACDKEPENFVYNPDSSERTPDMLDDPSRENPLLFKMHGDLQKRESIVITDEDYITFVQRMSDKDAVHPVPQTVRYRMQKWPTLFFGYSLRDYNLRLLFRTLRWRVDPANFPLSYSVDNHPDPLIQKVWQEKRDLIAFVTENLWTFVPYLYKEIMGKEFSP
ncbi:MAG: SIR2 family protein [Nitrospiria bacterium]